MGNKILKLEDVRRGDIAIAGGKGANLGELIGQGFPVPPGFVVPAQACEEFFQHIELSREIERLKDLSPERYGQYCSSIREIIEKADLPSDLAESIMAAHGELVQKRGAEIVCAVRSSGTAEDLGEASFAGQHETYYYVRADRLLQMVKHCWASLWSTEAVSYRTTQGIDHSSVFMAVVVQEMIQSKISGVTFTANPVTGDRDQIVTESSWGMGAVIVDGRAVRSCVLPVSSVEGKNVLTIEGLAKDGQLHPIQKAFIKHDALQCGFCTPGMILNAYSLLLRNPEPSKSDIIWGMENNLCRCASHLRIIRAVQSAAEEMKGAMQR